MSKTPEFDKYKEYCRAHYMPCDTFAFNELVSLNIAASVSQLVIAYAYVSDFSLAEILRKEELFAKRRVELNSHISNLEVAIDHTQEAIKSVTDLSTDPVLSATLSACLQSELLLLSEKEAAFTMELEEGVQYELNTFDRQMQFERDTLEFLAWIGVDAKETAFFIPYLSSLECSPEICQAENTAFDFKSHLSIETTETTSWSDRANTRVTTVEIYVGDVRFVSGYWVVGAPDDGSVQVRATDATFTVDHEEFRHVSRLLNASRFQGGPFWIAASHALVGDLGLRKDPIWDRKWIYERFHDVHPHTMLALLALFYYTELDYGVRGTHLTMSIDIDQVRLSNRVTVYEQVLTHERDMQRTTAKLAKARKEIDELEKEHQRAAHKRAKVETISVSSSAAAAAALPLTMSD